LYKYIVFITIYRGGQKLLRPPLYKSWRELSLLLNSAPVSSRHRKATDSCTAYLLQTTTLQIGRTQRAVVAASEQLGWMRGNEPQGLDASCVCEVFKSAPDRIFFFLKKPKVNKTRNRLQRWVSTNENQGKNEIVEW